MAGNLAAAERDVAPGTYLNLAGGAEITLNDLIALVGDVAGAPVAVEPEPKKAGDPSATAARSIARRELLGWEPQVSLREGIAEQIAWHRARMSSGSP